MSELKAGWVEALGRQLKGDSDVWQRTRARGGKPFSICADDRQGKASRGAHAGAKAKGINRKLAELPPEEDECPPNDAQHATAPLRTCIQRCNR